MIIAKDLFLRYRGGYGFPAACVYLWSIDLTPTIATHELVPLNSPLAGYVVLVGLCLVSLGLRTPT